MESEDNSFIPPAKHTKSQLTPQKDKKVANAADDDSAVSAIVDDQDEEYVAEPASNDDKKNPPAKPIRAQLSQKKTTRSPGTSSTKSGREAACVSV